MKTSFEFLNFFKESKITACQIQQQIGYYYPRWLMLSNYRDVFINASKKVFCQTETKGIIDLFFFNENGLDKLTFSEQYHFF